MEGLEKKAKASGASQLVVKDLKEEFVNDYIFPCLRAGAIYERKYLLGTSMARPVIAKVISQFDAWNVVLVINSLPLWIDIYTAKTNVKNRFLKNAYALPRSVLSGLILVDRAEYSSLIT